MDLLSKENITYIVIFIFILLSLTNLYNRINSDNENDSNSNSNSNLEAFEVIVEDQRITDIARKIYLPSVETVQFATISSPNTFESLGTKFNKIDNKINESILQVQSNVGIQIKTVNNNLTTVQGNLNRKVDETLTNINSNLTSLQGNLNKKVEETTTNVNNKITDLQNSVIIKDSAGNVNINCPITNITSNVVIGSRTKSNTLVILGNENSKSTHNNGKTNNGSNSLVIGHMSVPLTQGNISISTSKSDDVGLPSFSTINTIGRMHITGTESLVLLNKNGVNVSKAWGGNGNLYVDGNIYGSTIVSTFATNEGASISFNNPLKTGKKGLVDTWVIFNMTDQGPSEHKYANGLHFWKYGKELNYINGSASQLLLGDDGISEFNSTLKVKGNFRCDNEVWARVWAGTSDIRLKENIKNISQNDKDKVLQLVPKTYNFIKDEKKEKRYGLIAQEVEALFPELVSTSSTDGMKGLNYMDLIPLLLEQIKDMNQKIKDLDKIIRNSYKFN